MIMRRGEIFLSQYKDLERTIRRKTAVITELRMSLLPGGIAYDTVRVQTSPRDRFAEVEAEIVDKYYKLMADISRDVETQRKIEAVLNRLLPMERWIIRERFNYDNDSQRFKTLQDVSDCVHMSLRNTQRIYKRAINKTEVLMDEEKNNIDSADNSDPGSR